MAICEGTSLSVEDTFYNVGLYSTYFVLANVSIMAIGTIFTSIFLCVRRKRDDVPRFVILQMICLNVLWITFAIYYYYVLGDYTRFKHREYELISQTKMENFIASVGTFSMLLHDWLFQE